MLLDKQNYIRPNWTCGRYNAEKHVALMYNLLAGYSYFFEFYSADVIGRVLLTQRNGEVSAEKVAAETEIGVFQHLKQRRASYRFRSNRR